MGDTMVFLDFNQCKITNYSKIKFVSENCIEILIKSKKITLSGDNLRMTFFSKEEITIKGKISSIKFDDEI